MYCNVTHNLLIFQYRGDISMEINATNSMISEYFMAYFKHSRCSHKIESWVVNGIRNAGRNITRLRLLSKGMSLREMSTLSRSLFQKMRIVWRRIQSLQRTLPGETHHHLCYVASFTIPVYINGTRFLTDSGFAGSCSESDLERKRPTL